MAWQNKAGSEKKEIKFMRPSKNALPKRKRIIVYDVESKSEPYCSNCGLHQRVKNINVFEETCKCKKPSFTADSQRGGFARAFQVCLYDGQNKYCWTNESNTKSYQWDLRAIVPGGVIDKTLTALLTPEFSSKKANIYAHNGGKFDHIFLLGWLRLHADEFGFEIISVQSRIQRLEVWRKDTDRKKLSWAFVDSFSIIPLSLAKACKTFGLSEADSKRVINYDLDENDESWQTYGIQDVVSLYKILETFHKLIHSLGGEVGLTAPSTSMRLFMRRYLKRIIHRHKHFKGCDGTCREKDCERAIYRLCNGTCHGCLHHWFMSGYYGGRTEVFIKYGKGLRYYDINSSYPRAMLELMPVGQKVELIKPTLEKCRDFARQGYIGTLECEVFIPRTCKIPPLPYRHDGKLKFTIGHMEDVWGLAELELLYEPEVNGKIVSIKKAVFIKGEKIFADMVEDIYAYRDKKSKKYVDDGLSFICKLILNSLYGKFGMSPKRDSIIFVDKPNGEQEPYGAMPANGNSVEEEIIWKLPYFVDTEYMIPQIAKHITDLARIRLFYGMLHVMRKGGKVFYIDTDSMRINCEIEEGTGLGEWKEEEVFCKCEHKRDESTEGNKKKGHIDGKFQCHECNCEEFVRGNALESENILPKLGRMTQHTLNCDNDLCKGCLFVYKEGDKKSASKQYMKGIPGASQTSKNFDDMVYEGKALSIERVRQFKSVLNSWSNKKAKEVFVGPGITSLEKAHRSVYDKRFVLPNGDTLPYFVDKKVKSL